MPEADVQQQQTHTVILTHKYVVALQAFLASVDLVEIVGVLCYQLFTDSYFPWHLYPMMLNRAVELIVLMCSRGQVPSLYSIAQVVLSLLSLAVYARRQPCAKYSCAAPLVLYSVLLSYEIFVAIMALKLSRMPMADDEGHIVANWPVPSNNVGQEQQQQQAVGIQILGVSPRMMRARIFREVELPLPMAKADERTILAVQQPDGDKLAIARPCNNPMSEYDKAGVDPAAATSSTHPL